MSDTVRPPMIFAVTLAVLPIPFTPTGEVVDGLAKEARAVLPLVESPLAKNFLTALTELPEPEAREVLYRRATGDALPPTGDAEAPEGFELVELPASFYYYTRYGTPAAYVRALDLAAKHGLASADGATILDFGFGGIGHLRALAGMGATTIGIEVNELLRALYREPGDQGSVARTASAGEGEGGRVALFFGSFPGDTELRERVLEATGEGCDLIVAKNVLKRGYIHPEREADPRRLVRLGVDDATFVATLAEALAPGGLVVIYNLYPPQAAPEAPYIPHATGGCPFDPETIEGAGLEILVYDVEDDAAARAMGSALGWDEGEGAMELERDLFGMYTVLRKPKD